MKMIRLVPVMTEDAKKGTVTVEIDERASDPLPKDFRRIMVESPVKDFAARSRAILDQWWSDARREAHHNGFYLQDEDPARDPLKGTTKAPQMQRTFASRAIAAREAGERIIEERQKVEKPGERRRTF